MSRPNIQTLLNQNLQEPHPGLLLTRGVEPASQDDGKAKDAGLTRIIEQSYSTFYKSAFEEWQRLVSDKSRFLSRQYGLANRLYIGLSRDNPLETGMTLHHTYGMPLIPGSACKGLARSVAEAQLANTEVINWLFGEGGDAGESGGLIFHDAWWVPSGKPFVREIVTPHHIEYYKDGATPATDFDSPIPAPQLATHGSFLFVLEGPPGWTELGMKLLNTGLTTQGIGGKKSSGYGLFKENG